MKKKSIIIKDENGNNIWACLNIEFAKQKLKKGYTLEEDFPHHKAYLVSYRNLDGQMDYKICISEKSYHQLIDSLVTFNVTVLDIWLKDDKEELPEILPDSAIIIMQTNSEYKIPIFAALTMNDAVDGMEWIHINQPELKPKISEQLIKIYNG